MSEAAVASITHDSPAQAAGPAKFVWYDLMTTDTKAATAFYHDVIGWEATDSHLPGHAYTYLSAGPTMIGGLMELPAPGIPPGWMGYIGVDDVDGYTARAAEAGGKVHVHPRDIPEVGRFSMVADPQGAMFYIFKGLGTPPEDAPPGATGRICWHELTAPDVEADFAFYAGLFGWAKDGAHDMGAMGVYQMFSTGDVPVGGMVNAHPGAPAPQWLYYFSVDAVDAAARRVAGAGGKVLHGPVPVPGGFIAVCADPQGAMFGLAAMQG
jgi:predicted enzyme related to lactoylglutathione lyase